MISVHRDIEELINELRLELGHLLDRKLYGLYLYNSVAMGKFEPKYSDIDFMVIINEKLTNNELSEIIQMHENLSIKHKYGSKLDGMYIHYSDIGKMNTELEAYPYIHDGNFCKEGYFDINYITWWSLKEYNMSVDSPSIKVELADINWSGVLKTIEYNLNCYWTNNLQDTQKFEEDMWVEFGIVTLSRIIYTLKKGKIISKTEGCNYLLEDYREYHDIVREALAIRDLKPKSIINDISIRRDKAVEFINNMIKYGNMLLKLEGE